MIMNIIKGTVKRIVFLFTKRNLAKCGKHTLFEYPYICEGEKYISVGENIRCKAGLHLAAIDYHNGLKFTPSIKIENNESINYDVHIAGVNSVSLGEGCLLASKIFITDHFHGGTSLEDMKISPSKRLLHSKGPVKIGKNVWIGENVAIMPNVSIGEGAIVGANSVVTKNVPSYSVVAGNPAEVIKSYKEDI